MASHPEDAPRAGQRRGGDYLARFFNDDHVSDANVLAANLVFVVQRCAGNSASTEHNRLEFRNRR